MSNYENFDCEAFLSDEFFIEWVLDPKEEHLLFWGKWLAENPEKKPIIDRARTIIRAVHPNPVGKQLSDEEVLDLTQRFKQDINDSRIIYKLNVFRRYSRWIGAAAAILICAVMAIVFSRINNADLPKPSPTKRLVVVNKGKTSRLIALSDGSMVVLRPSSSFSYPKSFSGSNRIVSLRGEAFFEVHKDPHHPFLVYSAHAVTKVLGTSFTVSAFPGENNFKVTVNTGKVQVFDLKGSRRLEGAPSVILLPEEQVVLTGNDALLRKDFVKEALVLSPRLSAKAFTFTNVPVPAVLAKLKEAYQVDIQYDQAKYSTATITASLSRLPLEEKVKAICKAIGASYELTDEGFTIK
jgi:transmembrane sensor